MVGLRLPEVEMGPDLPIWGLKGSLSSDVSMCLYSSRTLCMLTQCHALGQPCKAPKAQTQTLAQTTHREESN